MWIVSFTPLNIKIAVNCGDSFPSITNLEQELDKLSNYEAKLIKKCLSSLTQPWIQSNKDVTFLSSLNDNDRVLIAILKGGNNV